MIDNWRRVLINADTTIRDAIEIIDKASFQIALVTNAQDQLLGTITDGDIRRALLEQNPMTNTASSIMNPQPVTAEAGTSKHRLRHMMESKGLLQIPLTKEGKVTGLATLKNLTTQQRYDNPVFLMAGGFGTRLRPLTDNCPKPLLKVGDKPILETILESFIDAGFHRFYISTYYLNTMIEDYFKDGSQYGVSIEYIHEQEPRGTAGALSLLPDHCPDLPLIMMNGDILTKVNFEHLLAFHANQDAKATVCVREYDMQVPYGVIQPENGYITAIEEKPVQSFFINAGIYVIDPEVRRQLTKGQHIDMPQLLQQLLGKEDKVAMFPIHEYWLDIGKLPDFQQAQIDFQRDFQ